MGWDGMGWDGMEKITRHLLSGGRTLDLWTYPEATPAGQGEGPALDHAEIILLLRIDTLAATTAAKSLRRCRRRAAVVFWQAAHF